MTRLWLLLCEWLEWRRVREEPELVQRWRALIPQRVSWYPSQLRGARKC